MLSVNYENKENIMIVRMSGELLIENVNQLKSDFDKYKVNYKYFIFDFKDIRMIDSSGLGYIVYCLKNLREKNGDIKIQNLLSHARLIFEITRVISILDVFDNEKDAIKSIKDMENENEGNDKNRNEVIS